jgi:flagella basal body P-ring formation protein FlgA
MIRLATALLLSGLAFGHATFALAQNAPVFRSTVLVSGDVVRIGDLVENIRGDKAQIAVFRAPDLGETGNVPVARVLEVLRPHDVGGIETAGLTEVSVTRASRMVGSTEIRARIAEIMAERLRIADPNNVALTLDISLSAIHLDPSDSGPLAAIRVNVDPRGGRFDIVFRTNGAPLRVTGTAAEAFDAVVATRALARGEILRGDDVVIEKRPKTEMQSENLRDVAAAIGLEVRQGLRPGQVVRSSDVVKQQFVKRGEPVILNFEVPGIVLTARGKAEDNGTLGDVVNITNVQSKRIIQGTVTGPGQVTVTSLAPRITTAAANLASSQRGSAPIATRP